MTKGCLILGGAGIGKTHFKHLLLKRDPPKQRISTALADNPVRAVSFTLAGVSGEEDNWFLVEDSQAMMKFVGSTIGVGNVFMATSLEEVVSTLPKVPIKVSTSAVHDLVPVDVNVTMDATHQNRTIAIEEELIHHFSHFTGTI